MNAQTEHLPVLCYDTALTKEHLTTHPYRNIGDLLIEKSETVREVMRECGTDEAYITGDTSDYEKWLAFCGCIPQLPGHPVRKNIIRLFRDILQLGMIPSPYTADFLWENANRAIEEMTLSPLSLVERCGIETLAFRHPASLPLTSIPESVGIDIIPLADFSDHLLTQKGIRQFFSSLMSNACQKSSDYQEALYGIHQAFRLLSSKGCRSVRILLDSSFSMIHQTRRHTVYDSFSKVMKDECLDTRSIHELTSACLESIGKLCVEENMSWIIEDRGVSAEEMTKLYTQLVRNKTVPITVIETERPANFKGFLSAFTSRTANGHPSPLPVSRKIEELSAIFPVGYTLAPFFGYRDVLSLLGVEEEYATLAQSIIGLQDPGFESIDEFDLPTDSIAYGNIKAVFDGI